MIRRIFQSYWESCVINVFVFFLVMLGVATAQAGLLNRLGSPSPLGLSTSGAGDTVGLHEGPVNTGLNPAALTTVDGLELYLGNTFTWTDFSFQQSPQLGGQHFEAKDELFLFPELALAYRIDDHWIVGAQLWVPWGLAADFDDMTPTFPGYNTELVDLQTALAVAYQFNEEFSLAASLNVDYIDFRFRLPTVINNTFLGLNSGDADGVGVGGSFGALWRPGKWSFGIKYSLPSSIDIDGHTDFPPGLGIAGDDFSADVDLPQRVAVGISYELTEWWTVAVDGTFTDYEQSDNFVFDFDNLPPNGLPLNWENVWSIHAGNQFQVTDQLTWKNGAGWLSQGMPDDTLIPSIPDTPGWIVSTGVGYEFNEHVRADASVAYAWGERDIGFAPTRPGSGELHSDIWLAGIGLNFSF